MPIKIPGISLSVPYQVIDIKVIDVQLLTCSAAKYFRRNWCIPLPELTCCWNGLQEWTFIRVLSGGFRGGSGGLLEPPLGSKLFQFHGEMYEKSGKMLKTNPLLMDLNPTSRNPGSAPGPRVLFISFLKTVWPEICTICDKSENSVV